MISDLSIFNVAGAMARHAAARHRVIAENVANADTPGFRARDLAAFDPKQAERASHIGHGRDLMMQRMMEAQEIDNAASAPNGNSVEIDDQMARAVDAQAQHNSALAIYRKSLDLLRLSFRVQR